MDTLLDRCARTESWETCVSASPIALLWKRATGTDDEYGNS
jgi:hypothetical protein